MRNLLLGLATAVAVTLAASAPSLASNGLLGGIHVGKNADAWEIRGGISAYDLGIFSSQKLGGFVIDAEALAPSPAFLKGLGAPRPYVGMDLPVSDEPIDMFYTGINWETYFGKRFYLGFSLGGAVASKRKVTNHLGETKDLGSSVLFHLQASAGYDLTPNMTVQLYYNHFSNARLARPDPGLESVGARIGYRF